MSHGDDTNPNELDDELLAASIDSAEEASEEHDREREAHHRQGLIEKNTREHHLDEG